MAKRIVQSDDAQAKQKGVSEPHPRDARSRPLYLMEACHEGRSAMCRRNLVHCRRIAAMYRRG